MWQFYFFPFNIPSVHLTDAFLKGCQLRRIYIQKFWNCAWISSSWNGYTLFHASLICLFCGCKRLLLNKPRFLIYFDRNDFENSNIYIHDAYISIKNRLTCPICFSPYMFTFCFNYFGHHVLQLNWRSQKPNLRGHRSSHSSVKVYLVLFLSLLILLYSSSS